MGRPLLLIRLRDGPGLVALIIMNRLAVASLHRRFVLVPFNRGPCQAAGGAPQLSAAGGRLSFRQPNRLASLTARSASVAQASSLTMRSRTLSTNPAS